jgi:hypothetical protein
MILIDRSVNAGVVGFRGSTQPTGGNSTSNSVVSDTAINPSSILIDILFKQSTFDVNTKQTSIGQVTSNGVSLSQAGSSQISISQISTVEATSDKTGIGQISSTEIGSIQIDSLQIGLGQILPAEINSTQAGNTYYCLKNLNPVTSKVSDSTSVESQNFFILNPGLFGHNPNLQNTTEP